MVFYMLHLSPALGSGWTCFLLTFSWTPLGLSGFVLLTCTIWVFCQTRPRASRRSRTTWDSCPSSQKHLTSFFSSTRSVHCLWMLESPTLSPFWGELDSTWDYSLVPCKPMPPTLENIIWQVPCIDICIIDSEDE